MKKKKLTNIDIDFFHLIIDKVIEKYYNNQKLYNKIVWDMLYWFNGIRALPRTKELRAIIDEINREKK